MTVPAGYLAELERNARWQATAENKDGRTVAILRGDPSGFLEPDFWVYRTDASEGHTRADIKRLFASGRLKLVKGSIPDKEL